MQFAQTALKIVYRNKTQTARLVGNNTLALDRQGNAGAIDSPFWSEMGEIKVVINEKTGRTAYETGQRHAVQMGRGLFGIWNSAEFGVCLDPVALANRIDGDGKYASLTDRARRSLYRMGYHPVQIKITAIRLQDVRTYALDDFQNEGFQGEGEFLSIWTTMHDPRARFWFDPQAVDYNINTGRRRELVGWHTVKEIIDARPRERYLSWILNFEVVTNVQTQHSKG